MRTTGAGGEEDGLFHHIDIAIDRSLQLLFHLCRRQHRGDPAAALDVEQVGTD